MPLTGKGSNKSCCIFMSFLYFDVPLAQIIDSKLHHNFWTVRERYFIYMYMIVIGMNPWLTKVTPRSRFIKVNDLVNMSLTFFTENIFSGL